MLERLSDFNYTVTHLPGSQNHVVDFLSRYPSTSQGAPKFPRQRASVPVRTMKADRIRKEDASLWEVAVKSEQCATTRKLIETVQAGQSSNQVEKDHPARALSEVWDSAAVEQTEKGLILTFGDRVYIPSSLRKELMLRLHSTHMSSEMMLQTRLKPKNEDGKDKKKFL